MSYQILQQDCNNWMCAQPKGSINCIVTSPPYNLDIKYGKYQDDLPRESYLKWLGDVAQNMKHVLTDDGHLFLNVGYSNVDPWVAMDVAQVFREHFVLQNNFTWVKHIKVGDKSSGIYKPINSNRFASPTTESIFHFTKTGNIPVDRLSIGHCNTTHEKYPELYSEARHISGSRRKVCRKMGFKNYLDLQKQGTPEQLEEFNDKLKTHLEDNPYDPAKKKCIGNAWYIQYTPTSVLAYEIGETSNSSREQGRGGHPATFPEALSTQCIKFSGIKPGSTVYDPFLGTGTTLISAVKCGMNGIGTDIDEKYLDFARRRCYNVLEKPLADEKAALGDFFDVV